MNTNFIESVVSLFKKNISFRAIVLLTMAYIICQLLVPPYDDVAFHAVAIVILCCSYILPIAGFIHRLLEGWWLTRQGKQSK